MAYNVNHTDSANYGSLIVEDKTLNLDTSLALVGKHYPGYSKHISENFLHLLENFASNVAPENPVRGQLWFDTDSTNSPPLPQLMMWNGTRWLSVGIVSRAESEPVSPADGDIWVDPLNYTMKIWSGTVWKEFITDIVGGTGVKNVTLYEGISPHDVLVAYIQNKAVAIFSWDDEFTPDSILEIESFDGVSIKPGINLAVSDGNGSPKEFLYYGIAEKALLLKNGSTEKSLSDLFIKDTTNETTGNIVVKSANGVSVNDITLSKTIVIKPTNNTALIPAGTLITSKNDMSLVSNDTAGTPTAISILASTVTVNKSVEITGDISATNAVVTQLSADNIVSDTATIGGLVNITSTGIYPASTLSNLSLGDQTSIWKNIYTDNLFGNTVGIQNVTNIYGKLHNSVRYNNNEILSSGTTFNLTNDVTGSATGSGTTVSIPVTLVPNIISKQSVITSVVESDQILVERSSSLKSITVENLIKSTKLIGEVITYAGLTIPDKHKLCNGQQLNKVTYADLYAAIGGTFGETTTDFTLPNIPEVISGVNYYIYAGVN